MSGLGQLPCSSGRAPPGHDATAACANSEDDDDDDVDEKVVAARRPVAAAASKDELNFIRRRSVPLCVVRTVFVGDGALVLRMRSALVLVFLPESREDSSSKVLFTIAASKT
jgi:hypothetical protein